MKLQQSPSVLHGPALSAMHVTMPVSVLTTHDAASVRTEATRPSANHREIILASMPRGVPPHAES
jgi:hypothetical protein